MEYRLELFLHEEDAVVEQRVSLCPHPVVMISDTVCVNFANSAYNVKYGEWFRVTDRRVYIFEPNLQIQSTRLYLAVDSSKGAYQRLSHKV